MAATLSTLGAAVGLAWIALSLRRHAGLLGGVGEEGVRRLRLLGVALVAAAPLPWVLSDDWAQALVTWGFCLLPLAGLAVALALAFQPERLVAMTLARRIAGASPGRARGG